MSKADPDGHLGETAVLVLAGGRSSRMGTPKGFVRLYDGRTMLSHVLDAVLPLQVPVYLSVEKDAGGPFRSYGIPVIEDSVAFNGPLAAIVQGFEQLPRRQLLVVCCDQPLLRSHLLRRQAVSTSAHPVFFRDEHENDCDPFPGLFPRELLSLMKQALGERQRSVRRVARSVPCNWIPITAQEACTLASFNCPQALREAGLVNEVSMV
jgi:molybdopterin-guanine dinucleotide biosynthesis protein A